MSAPKRPDNPSPPPVRIWQRLIHNARRRQLYNPLRWPGLVWRLGHHLRLRGMKRTLVLLQSAPPISPAPVADRHFPTPRADAPAAPVDLAEPKLIKASVIVPVFNQVHFTAACLNSLVETRAGYPFELIVVDDASSDETRNYLAACRGIKVIRNTENQGFVGSCNSGAEYARGEVLVFLNNDTTLTEGWLSRLVDTFDADDQVGVVGARLIHPDGRLQEAGGIVFADGHCWNYGGGSDPDRPEFNFVCEADYVSGACLAIRRELFTILDGFDAHFAPAYYEDTDLCFRARQAGWRVIYQPACTIIHHEGATAGTDISAGIKQYQKINRKKFRQRWAAVLKRQPRHDPDWDQVLPVRRHRHHFQSSSALVIDALTPTPDQDSGSLRMEAMLDILTEFGYRTTFIPFDLNWLPGYSDRLQASGIEVVTAPWIEDIEDWLKQHGHSIDLVLVSRHYVLRPLLKLIRHYCPGARLVFDTVDLHHLREQREAEFSGLADIQRQARITRRRELALVEAADATLVVSPVERELLAQTVPTAQVAVVSNIHVPATVIAPWDERKDLMFVGGFQHKPNVDAIKWLIEDIFPEIRAHLPEVRLHLIGSRMPGWMQSIDQPGIRMHGHVADITPFLNGCRVSLAPLRFGAGVKGKVNQAMAHGLPVVATTCAAEGLHVEPDKDILIADQADAFAGQVQRLYQDPVLWQQLSTAGVQNVQTHFSRQAAAQALSAVLAWTEPPRS
jgi:O-antigen biosynthesis protein